jgi:hypothetical protein
MKLLLTMLQQSLMLFAVLQLLSDCYRFTFTQRLQHELYRALAQTVMYTHYYTHTTRREMHYTATYTYTTAHRVLV